jgi:putative transposase
LDKGIRHVRGHPYHPMMQGKIERYHRSMKNRILLEKYYLPGQLELSIGEFVEYYNNQRHHESLDNLTRLTFASEEVRPFSSGGKASNGKPSNNAGACISRQSQPETSNQMSQTIS